MAELAGIGLATAFVAGLVSFASPCVLPLVPGYVSYVAGESLSELEERALSRARMSALLLSVFFVLGFSAVFIALGASASAIGEFLLAYKAEAGYAGGGAIILFGLFLTGLVPVPWFKREARFNPAIAGGHPASAFVLGAAFGFGWTPCIGPVLGAILTVSATRLNMGQGVVLLAVYSLGLGVPFVLAAAFTGAFVKRLKRLSRIARPLQIATGGVLILMGAAIISGYLSSFAFWMLEAFPALGRIG